MRIERYLYTALLATLLWPLFLWLKKDPLFDLMLMDREIALYLLLSLFGGTIAGIWCIGAKWRGDAAIISVASSTTRISIAVLATGIFSIPCLRLLQVLDAHVSYVAILLNWGSLAFTAVWIATYIVDILKRQDVPRAQPR
jgi:hypothetical protein